MKTMLTFNGLAGSSHNRGLAKSFLLLAFLLVFGRQPASAITWTGSVSRDWNNPTNWNPASVPGPGDTAVINSGEVTPSANSQFAVLNFNGGYIFGPMTVRSNSVLNWSGGRLAQGSQLSVSQGGLVNMMGGSQKELGGAMTNAGRVVWSGGYFYMLNDGGTWQGIMVNLGVFEVQVDNSVSQWWGNDLAVFQNEGFFRKTSGTGSTTMGVPFQNALGTVEALSGTLRFDRGIILDGLFNTRPGATVQFNGGTVNGTSMTKLLGSGSYYFTDGLLTGLNDYLPNLKLTGGDVRLPASFQTNGLISRFDLSGSTLVGSNRVTGTFNFYSGYIRGAITVSSNAVFNWMGGRFAESSSLVVEKGGVVNILSGATKEMGGTLTNRGSVAWSSGGISLINNGSTFLGGIENELGGVWEAQDNLSMWQSSANNYAYFRNNGILRKIGTGNTTMDIPLINQGIIESLAGVLNLGRTISLTEGTVTFGLGSAGYGRISASGVASLGGRLAARLLGGFIPSTNQAFQVMSFSSGDGAFTNYDGLNLGFGYLLTPAYTPTSVTLQAFATNGINQTPTWIAAPGNYSIAEGATLTFTNAANDPDGNQLFFKLISAPNGAIVNLTNGVFSWTPSETQAPSTNSISLAVFDNGAPSLSLTQTFSVVVYKTNTAPVLQTIGVQLIGAGGTLTVTNAATDADMPTNTLTYSLLSAPAGATVDSGGRIQWSPTNAGNFQITTKVSDNGTPPLSATNTFVVNVLAQPVPPAGLVSWWTGDGTTADKMGLNDGTLTGAGSYAPGLFGQGFNFTGGYLTVLHSPLLSFPTNQAMTVEMWVKRTQGSYPAYYFGKQVGCGTYNYQSPSEQFSPGAYYDPPVGEWRHFTWVYGGGEMLGYVNGVLVYRVEAWLGAENSAALFIGNSGTCGHPFQGVVDEVRIYNRALTSNEVGAVYGGQSYGPPVIAQQPVSQRVALGSNVALNVSVYGGGTLSYQWRLNGSPISGQTASVLNLTGVSLAQSGAYDVVVSNAMGVATSSSALISVLELPRITSQPTNQTAGVGSLVTFSVTATGTPTPSLLYQWRKDGVPLSGAVAETLTLNNIQLTDAGSYDVVVYNVAGSVTSSIVTLTIGQPLLWTGSVSREWNNPTNWNPAQVPGASDTVVINSGYVTSATNARYKTLTLNGGYLGGPVSVAAGSVMNWSGGRLDQGSSLTVSSNGLVNVCGNGQKELGGAMTNFGQVVWSGGSFYCMNDGGGWQGMVTNAGLWEMQGDLSLTRYWGNATTRFYNGGTFRKTGGGGIGYVQMTFFNEAGIVEAQNGTLRFDLCGSMNGPFIAQTGSMIQFNGGTFNYVPHMLTGPGQYQLTGGALEGLDDNVPNLQLLGGTVGLSPAFQTNGVISRLDLNGSTLTGSNVIAGVLNIAGGGANGPLIIASNAVLNVNGAYIYGLVLVKSNSVFNWSGGRLAQGSSLVVEKGGLLNLIGGNQKELGGVMTNSGWVVWSGGGLYLLNDGSSWSGTVINMGVWEMQGDLWMGQWWGNDLASFQNNNIFRKTVGQGTGGLSLSFVNTYGTLEVRSGALRFDHGQTLDGVYMTGPGAGVQFNSGTFNFLPQTLLTGKGWYQLTGGTLNGLDKNLPNLQLTGGTVTLSPSFQTNGAISRLDLAGTTLAGANRVSGVLNMGNGGVNGPLTVVSNGVLNLSGTYVYGPLVVSSNATLNWYSGRIAQGGSLMVESNGLVNLLGGSQKELGGRMTNWGTVLWSAGNFNLLNDNSSWQGMIYNFGAWEIQGDPWMGQWWANNAAVFNNTGVLRKTAGLYTTTLSLPVVSEGRIEPLVGSLKFDYGADLSASTVKFGLGSSGPGKLNFSGAVTLGGPFEVSLLDGFVPGTNQAFQVLSFGSVSGTFSNTDTLDMGFGILLSSVYTGTSLTLQASPTNGLNSVPAWTAIPAYTINEGDTLRFTNSVSDPNGNQILYQVVSGPSGALVNLTNGVFTWTPTEAQGPGSNNIKLRIFDSGSPSLAATQTFAVVVNEVNSAPILPLIAPQIVGVGGTIAVNGAATDPDLPANKLTYSLIAAPAGMSVGANGLITWAPANPGNYQATLTVTDDGVPALSVTNTFSVTVLANPVPPAGLVSRWTGDGTTADQTGLNDGVLAGDSGYGSGLFGKAFLFNGGNLAVLHSPSLSFSPSNSLTMEMWVKRVSGNGAPFFFGKRQQCNSYNYQSPSDIFSDGTAYDVPVGEWRHFAWVFTGGEMLGYVNGALLYRTEMALGPENVAALFIGSSGCGQSFFGLVDEVRLYSRALTAGEVASEYGAQNFGVPFVSQQPVSQNVHPGDAASFSVGASGAAPLTYQWRFNGIPLSGKTTATLNLAGVTLAQSGVYDVVVSNAFGAATSMPCSLWVFEAPSITQQPMNLAAGVGSVVSFTVAATGTPTPVLNYQWRKGGVPLSGATGATLTLNNIQLADAGNYDVIVFNLGGSATSSTAKLTVSIPLVWTGAVSRDWNNPANWDLSRVPGADDTAVINSGYATISTNAQFNTLSLNGGNLGGPVYVAPGSTMNWTGGRMDQGSSLTVAPNGFVNLNTGTQKELGGALTNYGRVLWTGGNLYIMNDGGGWQGMITNAGVWEMQGDLWLGQYWSNPKALFQNGGVFRKTAGVGMAYIAAPFFNEPGTLEVQSGTVRFDNGGSLNGPFVVQSGAVLQLNGGNFTYVPGRFMGAGLYQLTSGSLQGLDDNLPNLQLLGGTVSLSPTFQTNGTIVRLDLNGSTLAGSNRVVGVLNAVSGGISGALTVAPNATLNLSGTYAYGPVAISSNAVFNWYHGRFAQGSSLAVAEGGLVNMSGGNQKELGGAMVNAGRVIWNGGGLYLLNDGSSWTGAVTNLGVWEMQGDVWIGEYWGNNLASFQNLGVFRKSSGTGTGGIGIVFLNAAGTMEVQSGTLQFNHSQTMDGLFVTGPGTIVQLSSGTFVFTPQTRLTGGGTFQLTGGTLQGLTDFVPNLQLNGGTVVLSPTFQTNGSIARLDLNGSTLAGSNIVSGTLNITNGALTGPLIIAPNAVVNLDRTYTYSSISVSSNAVFNWYGGRIGQGGSLLVQSNGLVNLLSGNQKELGGTMTNGGRVVWSGGNFYLLTDNSSWFGMVTNNGIWEAQGDYFMGEWWNNQAAAFVNNGVFRKTGGTGALGIGLTFLNGLGTVESRSGAVRFDHDENLDGTYMAAANALIQLGNGTFNFTSQTRLAGEGQIQLIGGLLQGLNDYLPNLQLLGGSVSLSPSFQTNGAIVRLDLNGSTLVGTNRVTGVLNFASGAVNGPLVIRPNGVLNWSGGRFADKSSLLVESNGLANLLGAAQKELGSGLTNAGLVAWSGGNLQLLNDASSWKGCIENQGVFDVQGDLSMNQYWGNNYAYFRNAGYLRKATGNGAATINVLYYNQGTIEQLSGALAFGQNFSLTDGTVVFGLTSGNNYGRINMGGIATLAGHLVVRLLDGFVPDVNQSFQVMSYGAVSGTFTNYDGLNVGFGRYLTPAYTGTGLSLQAFATNGINHPPVWSAIPNFTIVKGTALTFTNAVSDPDNDLVLFKMVDAPAGAVVNLTNGIFSWTPTESQGPSTNLISMRIFDSGSPSMGATQSFTVIVLESPHPDLIATNLTVIPSVLLSGTNVTIRWQDANMGNGAVLQSFSDRVVVSNKTTSRVILDSVVRYDTNVSGAIPISGMRDRSLAFRLPDSADGAGNFVVQIMADANAEIAELNPIGTAELNNSATNTFVSSLAPYPDLAITNLTVTPVQLQTGVAAIIRWQDTNMGSGVVTQSFADRIVVVNTNSGQTLLDTIVYCNISSGGPITNGTARDRSVNFQLPDSTTAVGLLQITVTVDRDNQVFECALGYDAETNNIATIAKASTLAPYPDLQIVGLSVSPALPTSATDIVVSWQETNSGNASVVGSFWERVLVRNLTTGHVLTSPTLYYDATVVTNGPIAPGKIARRQFAFHLPDGLEGAGSISVEVAADYYSQIVELNLAGTAESNNSVSNTFTSTLKPYPDLVVSHLGVSPASLFSGQNLTVTWRDDNVGNASITAPFSDHLVIRNLDTARTLLDTTVYCDASTNNPIIGTGNRARSLEFRLPDSTNAIGNLQISISADSYNQIFEAAAGMDAEANNSANITATSSLAPYPDLQIIGLTVTPQTPSSGTDISISWQTTNSGNAVANGSFTESILIRNLDTGEVLGMPTLLYDISQPTNGLIGVGEARSRQSVFHLSDGLGGAGRISVVITADSANQITELNLAGTAEMNNSATNTLVSTLSSYPDLVVSNLVNPATGASASAVALSWTVRNQGPSTASGIWSEKVYLSTDAVIGDDQLLGTFFYTNTIASGQSITRSQSVNLPLFGAGQHWFIVAVDAGGTVYETNEVNNTLIGASPLNIPQSATLAFSQSAMNEGWSATGTLTRNGATTNAVTFAMSGFDTNRLAVPPSVVLGINQQAATFTMVAIHDGLANGDTNLFLLAKAAGFQTASNSITVVDVDVPTLTLTAPVTSFVENAGANSGVASVVRNSSTNSDLVVNIISSDTTHIVAPASVVISAGERTNWFFFSTVNNTTPNAPASVTLSAVATGFRSGSTTLTVTDDDIPVIGLSLRDSTVIEGSPNPATLLTITRSPVSSARARFSLQSTMPSMISVPYSAIIDPDQSSVVVPVNVGNNNYVDGRRTAQIIVSALDDALGIPIPGAMTSTNIIIEDDDGPTLSVSLASDVISEAGGTTGTVTRNTSPLSDLVVSLTGSPSANVALPETITIHAGQASAVFDVAGVSDNVPSGNKRVIVTASAAGYNTGSAPLNILDVDLPDLRPIAVNATNRALTGALVPISFVVTNSGLADAADYWIDRVYLATSPSGDGLQLLGQASHMGGLALGASYTNTVGATMPTAAGDYYVIVVVNDNQGIDEGSRQNNRMVCTHVVSVAPSYRATIVADVQTAISGAVIPLHGKAWNTSDNSPAANAYVTVRALIKGTRRVIDARSDASGNITSWFQPLPNEAGVLSLAADHPGVSTDTVQDTVNIYGVRFDSFELTQRLYPNVPATNSVDVLNLGDLPVTGLSASFEGLPNFLFGGISVSNGIDASHKVSLTYTLMSSNVVSATVRARIRVQTAEGASAYVPITINISPLTTTLVSSPGIIDLGVVRGTQKMVQFDISNMGGIESGLINVQLPNIPWLSLSSPSSMPSVRPGETVRVTAVLTPPADAPLNLTSASIYFAGQNGNLNVPVRFRVLSAAHGDFKVEVLDDYTYYVAGAPRVTNATVRLTDPYTGEVVAQGQTFPDGFVLLTNVMEGSYQMRVTAEKHGTYATPVDIVAGVQTEKSVFMDRETVSYRWTVTPTTIQDQYQVVLEPVFETEVPIPVVTLDNPKIAPLVAEGGEGQIELKLSNHGLIAAERVTIVPPLSDRYEIIPLVPVVDVLPAMSSITVPVTIRDKSGPAFRARKGNSLVSGDIPSCGKTFTGCDAIPEMEVKWSWICGDDRRWHGIHAEMEFTCADTNCWSNIKKFLEDKLKENAKKLIKGEVVDVRALPAEYACEIINIIAICAGITDQCALAALKAACGIATKDVGTAVGGAVGLANCFCPTLPSLLPSSRPPGPDWGGGWVSWPSGPGGPGFPILPTISWDYSGADCDPGLHPMGARRSPSGATQPGGVCARVRLRIEQQVALTRNAFLGALEIDNQDTSLGLTEVQVVLDIKDEQGGDANAKFFVATPELSGLSAVDGSGVLAPASSGSAKFTFIPTHDAAPDAPKVYRFGGTLTYVVNGNKVEVPLAPETLTVYPDPVLYLDYFLQRDVYSDDPFTDTVEPSEPFAMGLLVRNLGKGRATDFRLTTGQPKIIDNQKGLLIDFKIIGTQVGDQTINPSLSLRFGDIDSGKAEVAGFWMTSTLQGKFVEFNASFKHMDSLGGLQTSLIDEVKMHDLTHVVRADRAADDNKIDFLVNDVPDTDSLPDTLYFSDGSMAPVDLASNAKVDGAVSQQHLRVALTATMPGEWTYLTMPDPGPGYRLYRVVRSDNKEILVGTNAWTTDRSFPSALAGAVRENLFHLLDTGSTGSYTLYYRVNDPIPPVLVSVGSGTAISQTGPLAAVDVVFSKTIDLSTFNYADLSLNLDGGANLINSGVTVTNIGTNVYRISGLAALTGSDGNYQLAVLGAGIQDFGGNSVTANGTFSWAKSTLAPVVVSISKPSPDPRNAAVGSMDVLFSMAVDASSFTLADLTLTRDGGVNLINNDVTITALSTNLFRVGGLIGLTAAEGRYQFVVLGSGVLGGDGTAGRGFLSQNWTLITAGPVLARLETPSTPRNIVVQTLEVAFARPINPATFDWHDLTLTREGGPNLITGDVQVNRINDTTYRLSNFTWVQGQAGTYTMTVGAEGVQDMAANSGSGSLSASWTIDLGKPLAPTALAISPDTGVSSTDSITASNHVTLSGRVWETNLTVRIYDTTLGADLGTAAIAGTNFTAALGFDASGTHRLRVYAVDAAANVSDDAYINVFIDQSLPAASIDAVTPSFRTNNVGSITVRFSEAINQTTLDWTHLALTRGSSTNLITSNNITIQMVSSNVFTISGLAKLTTALGEYQFIVDTKGIGDLAGNIGISTATNTWTCYVPNAAPVLALIPNKIVDELTVLTFFANASDVNSGDVLNFTLEGKIPDGASINPVSGLFSWTPTESQGPSTNLFTVRVTDNGTPNLSDSTTLVVIVNEVNVPPVLRAVSNQVAYAQTPLVITNRATDSDIPASHLTFTLGAGAPAGAKMTSWGRFSWTPTTLQVPSTNVVTVIVTDDGLPALSATNQFTIIAGDYFELSVGSAVVALGQTTNVPLIFSTSTRLTNLTFTLGAPLSRLAGLTLNPNPSLSLNVRSQVVAPDVTQFILETAAGKFISGSQSLGGLWFTPGTNQSSAFVPLPLLDIKAVQGNGQDVPKAILNSGRVVLVGTEPLLEAIAGTNRSMNLILYGSLGSRWLVQNSLSIDHGVWTTFWQGTLGSLATPIGEQSTTNKALFYRAKQQ